MLIEDKFNDIKIVIIGLGYVGLPLALAFGKKIETFGVDKNTIRVDELNRKIDSNEEVEEDEFDEAKLLTFFDTIPKRKEKVVFIITVPTPIDTLMNPNLTYLENACREVGQVLKKGDLVIIESTVYPGCTEEFCVPILEKYSSLVLNIDFGVGYSPERINPGDTKNTLKSIVKITSGSTIEIAREVDELYQTIIEAGTYVAPSMKIAEAAKVLENIQRYVNISLMNELAMLFDPLNIDITEVLKAAKTKWNFHPYYPGLIGGPCLESASVYLNTFAKKNEHSLHLLNAAFEVNNELLLFLKNKIKIDSSGDTEWVAGINISFLKPGTANLINEKVNQLKGIL